MLSERSLDSRLLALSVSTSALPGPANVRILLSSGYAKHPGRRFPVLQLLHGTSGGAADWTTLAGAEQTTTGRGLIVVMPDIALNDGGGWCTNWYNAGAYGKPEWETFHIDQLIPFFDSNLRTIAGRDGRAIAGLSQGGFCSMSYAARHPDLFETALAFSGAPDTAYDKAAQLLMTPIVNTSAESQYAVFGWRVAMHRAVEEFSTLKDAGRSGFTLEGSGSATVTTPPLYRPGRGHTVRVGSRTLTERAGRFGRLTISVPLGPSDTVQEYPLDGPPLGTTLYTTQVSIAP